MTAISSLFFQYFYRYALYPSLRASFSLLAIFHRKIRLGLQMRRPGPDGKIPWLAWEPHQNPIWIHCASGEFEYAKPVISEIKAREPRAKILVTYFSPTYARAIQSFPGVDFACPLPWDRARDLRAFLDHHRPQSLLIARTDTWPVLLQETNRAGVPSLLFAATLSSASGRAKGLGRRLSAWVFSNLKQVYCVSEEDLKLFSELGFSDRTRVAGDTRYDQVQARLAQPKRIRIELFSSEKRAPVLVAGSTWEEDEKVLIGTIVELRKESSVSNLRWILAPHEPSDRHLRSLEERFGEAQVRTARYSTASTWDDEVLIIDQVGILAELYARGDFAFVGGSFKKSVHSVMEPLAAGCLTFVGPHHQNNREALEFRQLRWNSTSKLKMVQPVGGASELADVLLEAMSSILESDKDILKAEVRKRSGKSGLVAKWALDRWAPSGFSDVSNPARSR